MSMKKSLRFVSGLLVLTLLLTCGLFGTMAKYTSSASGTSTARVAKWDVTIGGVAGDVAEQTFDFELFEAVDDENVAVGVDENIIAPGTEGEFSFVIANASEVNAEYTVEFEVDNDGVPVEYSLNDGAYTTDLSAIAATALDMGEDATVKVAWRWAFEGTDSTNYTTEQTDGTDTTLGLAGTAAPSVSAKVVVSQVD